jgi:hypothetical protein
VDGARSRSAARRRASLAAAFGAVTLAVLGYAAFEFAGQASGHAALKPASSPPTARASQAAATATATLATPTPTPPATTLFPVPPRPRPIVPVSAVAFGPDGTADGDNPQNAARVLADPAAGWLTDWYATPSFGDLKAGTGLLLDMGRTVTITTIKLTLGGLPGANLELRVGAVPEFSALPVAATASDAGELLSLPLTTPARARYILLWFTRLPPDGAGTYQVFVHQVTIQGWP